MRNKRLLTDSGGAMASKEFTVVLEPNESPRLQSPFENVWFGSLQEVRTVSLAAHFTDEGPGGLSYAYEYDPAYLTLTSGQGEFRLKPLKFGLSQVKITATDAEGLAGETDFLVMTHDYRQEVTFECPDGAGSRRNYLPDFFDAGRTIGQKGECSDRTFCSGGSRPFRFEKRNVCRTIEIFAGNLYPNSNKTMK